MTAPRPAPSPPAPPIAILLSTYNGAAYLPAQLDSFVAQQGAEWTLLWRDDGSTDGSVRLLQAFAEGAGAGRCMRVDMAGHMGVMDSYMTLLRAALATGADVFAFSDQDDVWLPVKLARGRPAVGGRGAGVVLQPPGAGGCGAGPGVRVGAGDRCARAWAGLDAEHRDRLHGDDEPRGCDAGGRQFPALGHPA